MVDTQSLSRRAFFKTLMAGGAAMALGACGGSSGAAPAASSSALPPSKPAASPSAPPQPAANASAPAKPAASPAGWDELVKAAQQEGTVVLSAVNGDVYRDGLATAFESAYPGIKVQATFAPVFDQVPKLLAEQKAGKYLTDVFVNGSGPSVITLKPAGAVAPLKPALLLPEVLDTSAWLENRLWWADAAEPLTTLSFEGSVNSPLAYNTNQVDPKQFTSYLDFLKPEWQGKLCATDIRKPGPGGVTARFIYKSTQLGPSYLERLFHEAKPTLSSDQRQLIDWLATGTYPVGLFLSFTEVGRATSQGLPVSMVAGEQFKEGVPIGPGPGTVNLVAQAPHPNAAKLYINWLLSKQGQMAWQEKTHETSLRIDISKPKDLLPFTVPDPTKTYVDGSTEDFAGVGANLIAAAVDKGVQEAKA
ncbi:MAG TPA: extracellular solute-binding protein [Chloroflexota bacterium]|nr:extracellular solute-binding protein [Chloroflexota bacterium]